MIDFNMFIPKVKFELIPIKDLVANQKYQRNLSAPHIRRMAENFNLYQVNPVKVSRRDGINNVFNGQHTIETIAFISESRDTPVWCMIYDNLTYEEEAYIFAQQQKFNKTLMPFEIFNASVEAGNDDELTIKHLVESYNMTISSSKHAGSICAVSTLCHIFKQHGFHVLDRVLMLCIGAWEGDINSFSQNMLKGIMHLVMAYGDKMRDDLFKEKVGAVSVREIVRSAKERRSGSIGYAETMLTIYNSKLKVSLPWVKLRQKNNIVSTQNSTLMTPAIDIEREEKVNN